MREAERQEIAGGETTEFSGDIGSCPEIVSNEPLDLDEPDVASWVALAQGHHEPTLGWRRAVSSDAVRGFDEHTSVSIDVNALRAREVVYGTAGETSPEFAFCEGLHARQIELDITLATADGAVVTGFRRWFEPRAGAAGRVELLEGWMNPDNDRDGSEFTGALELGLDPALGGSSHVWVSIGFDAESVRGSLHPERAIVDGTYLPNRSSWAPVAGSFPDNVCDGGDPIGLDDPVASLGETPRAYYGRVAAELDREPVRAAWRETPYGTKLTDPPATEVSLRGGEPTHACISGDYVTVTAPLTIATADGRVTLTQPITLELFFGNGAGGHGRTAWVPAGDFEAQMGLAGVKLVADSYGAVEFTNSVDWTEERLEGYLSVQKWEAFTEQPANYPTLQWCKGPNCFVEPER